MAKDIVLSGSTYTGVEQIHFQTPSGGKATFVDAEINGVALCKIQPTFTYHKNTKRSIGDIAGIQTAVQLAAVANLTIA